MCDNEVQMLIACKKQKALIRKHKIRKIVNAIHDVLCSTWDSDCFFLLANTCLAAAAHQYWAFEEGLHHLTCHCDLSSAVAMRMQVMTVHELKYTCWARFWKIQKGTSADSATAVKCSACSLSGQKASIDAPQRESTLHTVFRESAKGLDRSF